MTNKTKTILIVLAIIAVVAGGYYYIERQKDDSSKQKGGEVAQETKKEKIIQELATKYEAVVEWDKNISYTSQLQERLINSNKPILFVGYISDVFIKDKKYFIDFTTDYFTQPEIHFTLECGQDKLSDILKTADSDKKDELDFFNDYAVVARINNLQKVKLQISGYPDEDTVELEYSSSDAFVADGSCIDFSYIGED